MNKQLTYGAVVAYIAVAINMIYTLFITPAIINGLGDEHYAIYVLNNSIISFFCIDFGLGLASTKFISNARAQNEFNLLNKYIGVINLCYLIIALAIGLIFFLLYINFNFIFKQENVSDFYLAKKCFLLSAIFCTLSVPFFAQNSLLISFEKNIQIKSCDIFSKILTFALILLSLFYNFDVLGVVLSGITSGLIVLIIKIILINRIIPVNQFLIALDKNKSNNIFIELFKFNIWATVDSISARLVFLIGPILLNLFATNTDVAIFGIIIALEGAAYSVTCALNNIFVSKIAQLLTKTKDTVIDFFENICYIQTFVAGLILIEFIGIGNWFIKIWIGNYIETIYYCMIIIFLSAVLLSPLQTISTAVILKSGIKNIAKISLIVGVLNVGLMSIFSCYCGVIGACLAISCSNFLRIILLFLLFKNEFMFSFNMYITKIKNIIIGVAIISVAAYFCNCYIATLYEAILMAIILFFIAILMFFVIYNVCREKFSFKSIFS